MKLIQGSLSLESKDCTACKYSGTPGKQRKLKWKQCDKCKGTGRRGNGRCRNCNSTSYSFGQNPGYVKFWDENDLEACSKCGGDYENRELENLSDNCPTMFWLDIPIVMGGNSDRRMTTAESLFGVGIYTIMDYGRHKQSTNDELIEYMRKELVTGKTKVQATKVVRSRDDLTLCSGFAILRADQGFSVVPYWN